MQKKIPTPKKLLPEHRKRLMKIKPGSHHAARTLRTILDSLPFLVGYVDSEQRYTFMNRAYEADMWFGLHRNKLIGCTVREAVGDAEYDVIRPYVEKALTGEVVHYEIASVHPGSAVPHREATYIPDICPSTRRVRGYTSYVQDVSARRRTEEQNRWVAHHDSLTGLPNRVLFRERLDEILAEAIADGAPVAALFIDLNRFKRVNDTFGHRTGDLVLQKLAQRLSETLRESEFAARLGGDEFGVLLPHVANAHEAEKVSRRLQLAIAAPVIVHGETFTLSASIGIALYPDHAHEAGALIDFADRAMFAVKHAAKG